MLSILVLLASGQFFSQACKQNNDCNLDDLNVSGTLTFGNFIARDGGTFAGSLAAANVSTGVLAADIIIVRDAGYFNKGIQFGPVDGTAFGVDCINDAGFEGSLIYLNGYSGSTVPYKALALCREQTLSIVASYNYVDGIPVGSFNARTIASGVVTSGNVLLGNTQLIYAPNRASLPAMDVRANMSCQCNTAGTGAGTVNVQFRNMTAAASVCSDTVACTTLTLSNTDTLDCEGSLLYNINSKFGIVLDVSACTTPPADCTCSALITTAP